jgi:hypothetical protein
VRSRTGALQYERGGQSKSGQNKITTTVDEVVEESTEIVIANYAGDGGRKRIETALKQDAGRLFGQIERGLTVKFRAETKSGADAKTEKTLEMITNLNKEMQFPQIAREPILLESGEILEGELRTVKHSKKTTMHKTSTSKKETQKDGKSETKE